MNRSGFQILHLAAPAKQHCGLRKAQEAVLRSRSARDLVTARARPNKKPGLNEQTGFSIWRLAVTYSHTGTPALPSAMHRFTSEFGMGSGGSNALLPPGKLLTERDPPMQVPSVATGNSVNSFVSNKGLWCYMTKPLGQLVLVSFTHYCASTPSLSTL